MTEYPLATQIAAVKREIALRERNYPRWVSSARLTPERAAFELGVMRAVLATLSQQDRGPSE